MVEDSEFLALCQRVSALEKLLSDAGVKARVVPAPLKPLSDALCAAFMEARGVKYAWNGAIDTKALKTLLSNSTDVEILERWKVGMAGIGWNRVDSVSQLAHKWNSIPTKPVELKAVKVWK